jgi:hypothetical protein
MGKSRRDEMRIAQRFSAGYWMMRNLSPKGTTESGVGARFSRAFGTTVVIDVNPALKHRAISGCPSGTLFNNTFSRRLSKKFPVASIGSPLREKRNP